MRITPIEKEDKTGRIITLRNAEISDAENLITYMKITSFETPFLLREPDEFHLTSEQEECFIQNTIDNTRELMLLATADGCHIGNCSLSGAGPFKMVSASLSDCNRTVSKILGLRDRTDDVKYDTFCRQRTWIRAGGTGSSRK